MKQTTFASTGFELVTKRTRKREFLEEMNLVVPWTELTGLIKPFAPASKTGSKCSGMSMSAKRLNPLCASRTSGAITNNKLGIKVQWARHLRKIVRSLSLPPVPRRIPLARLPLTALLALPQR